MFYPEDFKNKVKEVHPDWEELHQSLDRGSQYAGALLYYNWYPDSISIDTILVATSLEELQEMAKAKQVDVDLYSEWVRLNRAQTPLVE